MSANLEHVEKQARELSASNRAHLAEIMLETLREPRIPEIESAWEQEITTRVEAYNKGLLPTASAEEVFAEARRLTE
ncbi:MAG: addiction module protein [Chloroflexota bacterium]